MVSLNTSGDSLIAPDSSEVFVPASLVHQGELLPSRQEPPGSPVTLNASLGQEITEAPATDIVKVVLNS